MPRVGFEPMIPVLERAKTVHGLDLEAIVIGRNTTLEVHVWSICGKNGKFVPELH
jgi:hypothetical protein